MILTIGSIASGKLKKACDNKSSDGGDNLKINHHLLYPPVEQHTLTPVLFYKYSKHSKVLHPLAAHPDAIPSDQNRSGYLFPLLRSEEHTSELQSQSKLVCRLLLE